MKSGEEVALRKEKGIFCILFVAAWTKRMASGGTRPAGFGFDFKRFALDSKNKPHLKQDGVHKQAKAGR